MAIDVLEDPEVAFNDQLRMELGWPEVAKGLSQVLMGYAVLILGTIVGIGLVVIAIFGFVAGAQKGLKISNAHFWELYLGLGILSVIGIISFGIIVGGQFKCMMYAAERHGCRWFMFLCTACLFLGPAFQFASGVSSGQAISELKKNPGKMQEFHMSPFAQRLQLTGFAISTLYPLCFMLFLRAIAICLRLPTQAIIFNIFLLFGAVLVAATMYNIYKHPLGGPLMPIPQALLLGVGWLTWSVLYIGLIAMMRVSIGSVIGKVKSPLQM
jgi:hypothetical protein